MIFNKDILLGVRRIHFIGIGGSGMYPLAFILAEKGYEISGSDSYESDTLQDAKDKGLKIYVGHDKKNICGADLVVYSAAIKSDNLEIIEAKKQGIPLLERAKLLGILMNYYKNMIAVSGTHGKTTTSAMLTTILLEAGVSPTAVIGGKLPLIGGNSCLGKSDFAVCEACEYVDTFLNLEPDVGVILNIDEDHLDYFKNLEGVISSFKKFASKAKSTIIFNINDLNSLKAIESFSTNKIGFGFNESNIVDGINFLHKFTTRNLVEHGGYYSFIVVKDGIDYLSVDLKIPGKHNVLNALACIAVVDFYKIPKEYIKSGIENFTGTHRRLEILLQKNEITIMDDFAHHPTEIRASLDAVSKMGFKRIICIFQPHTYSRTSTFLKEFSQAFSLADIVIVSEILAVREKNVYNIYSEDLVKLMRNGVYKKTFDEITDYVLDIIEPGDLILTMGGGNVYKCANKIAKSFVSSWGK